MRKQYINRFSIFMIATMVFGYSFAQSRDEAVAISVTSQPVSDTTIAEADNTNASAIVGSKVLRSFEQTFKGVKNPFWSAGNKKYVAQFKIGDRQAVALFEKNGYLVHTILYGVEKHLPSFEKSLVHENYKDYVITATHEIIMDDLKLWLVTIQNCSGIIFLKILDGELYVTDHYTISR